MCVCGNVRQSKRIGPKRTATARIAKHGRKRAVAESSGFFLSDAGAPAPRERSTCNHGGKRVQDTRREAVRAGKAQARAQEQRSRLRMRNRLDLPQVRGRRGSLRASARALGGAEAPGLWQERSGGAEAPELWQERSGEGGQIRARRPSESAPRAVAERPDPRVRRPNSSGRRAGFKKPRLSCRQPEATECC